MATKYDIAIIGAGPGGYVAAIRAAQEGLRVVCIDRRKQLGGTCLNVGCIPSKALLQPTELLYHLASQGEELGLRDGTIDFAKLMKRKEGIVEGLTSGILSLFRHHHIEFLCGTASFVSPHQLSVTKEDGTAVAVEAGAFLIATGSSPIELPSLPFSGDQIVSSTEALSLKAIPQHLAVVGGGVIGVELASVYHRLGSEVTVIELLDHICPTFDRSLSQGLFKELTKQGIAFRLNAKVESALRTVQQVTLKISDKGKKEKIEADTVLVAVGRRPYTAGLGLEKVGIKTDNKGFIVVDTHFRTALPHVYAVGDVIEGAMLAHRASAEGVAVVEALLGKSSEIDELSIPNVIYTYPEVASVGLTQQQAEHAGLQLLIGQSYFRGNARARCSGETEGFVKILGDKETRRVVGLHILGPHASEMIAEGMLALQKRCVIDEIANAPTAHPTLSETIKEAALDALGRPIHHIKDRA